MMGRTLLPVALLALGLAGCSLAPPYQPPSAPIAPQFSESPQWKVAAPADGGPRGLWWEPFHDPELNTLEAQLGKTNPSLAASLARLDQARALLELTRAAEFPQVGVGVSALNGRISTDKPFYFPFFDPAYHDNLLGATVSYEFDLWGRIRNSIAASEAQTQASAGDSAALELSLRAELARDLFALRGLDRSQSLLDQLVDNAKLQLDLVQGLYQGGAANLSDVAALRQQWQNTRMAATDNQLQRHQLEHALAVLVGESPSQFTIPASGTPQPACPSVQAGLPSQLLERRPDIAAAERRVAAANAGIGVARAAYFPVFGLGGGAGFESSGVSDWITAPSRFWSLGPTLSLPLIDGGARDAVTDQAKAALAETVAQYRQTVLGATQEVEDQLSAQRELRREVIQARAAQQASNEQAQQDEQRYQGGIVALNEVVSTRILNLQAQLTLNRLEVRQREAAVQLIQALGGGWSSPVPHD